MTLTELLARFRQLSGDTVETYLWSDAVVTSWINEAIEEACIRKRLIFDKSTIILATPVNATHTAGAGTLTAATYYYRVSAINLSGETLASTETSFTALEGTGINVNWTKVTGATGYKIYGRSTGAELLMATVGDVATWLDDGSVTPAGALPSSNTTEDVVNITVVEDKAIYPLHSSIISIEYAYLLDSSEDKTDLSITERDTMDAVRSDWRTLDLTPSGIIVDDNSIELNAPVDADYTLWLEVYRKPFDLLSSGTDTPVIHATHHIRLLDWVLHVAYSNRDSAKYDPNRSADHLLKFENYFGNRPKANHGKRMRQDLPHVVKCWW